MTPRPPLSTLFPYTTLFRSFKLKKYNHYKQYNKERCKMALLKIDNLTKSFQNGEVEEQVRSEEHTSELQSRGHLVCRLQLEKKKKEQSTCKANQHMID